jgi:hypothetical protein
VPWPSPPCGCPPPTPAAGSSRRHSPAGGTCGSVTPCPGQGCETTVPAGRSSSLSRPGRRAGRLRGCANKVGRRPCRPSRVGSPTAAGSGHTRPRPSSRWQPRSGRRCRPQPDERPVAQTRVAAHVDAVEKLPGFFGGEHRGFTPLRHMLWAAHGGGRVEGQDAAGREPVEHHPDGREVSRPVPRFCGCSQGPVTAKVCKIAIGPKGPIYQQLARCCDRTVLRPSIVSLDTSPPGALRKEGRKA